MNDSQQLVQRFLDQELSGDERVEFMVRLGRDAGLRQQAIQFERMMVGVSQLPRPAVPARFVSQILERTAPAGNRWSRLTAALFAPRMFQWNLMYAGAAACLALAVGAGVTAGLSRDGAGTPAVEVPSAAATANASPAPVLVRLVVLQPGARSVQVAGDFNGWNPSRTPLDEVSQGAWSVTLPLEPGRYEYMFVVDGEQWIADPFAAEHNDDGFGARNAVLDVRAPSATSRGAL